MFSLTLFKIITVSKPNTLLRVYLLEKSECPTNGENWGLLPASQKVWTFSLSLVYPHQKFHFSIIWSDRRTHIGEKVSLLVFRPILPKMFPAACIYSCTITTFLKKLVGTIFLDKKHCPAELSPLTITHYLPITYGNPCG